MSSSATGSPGCGVIVVIGAGIPSAGRRGRLVQSTSTRSGDARTFGPHRRRPGKLVVTIAHLLSTVIDADRIVVVDRGRGVGTGTYRELLVSSPLYARLVEALRIGAV